mmetsp:Transcript_7280/g.9712  ORF Transcript_7280/g.9712 Transcript_7280/m.9712 type:complete len:222 (+) Transcript_7280:1831-2496(+)
MNLHRTLNGLLPRSIPSLKRPGRSQFLSRSRACGSQFPPSEDPGAFGSLSLSLSRLSLSRSLSLSDRSLSRSRSLSLASLFSRSTLLPLSRLSFLSLSLSPSVNPPEDEGGLRGESTFLLSLSPLSLSLLLPSLLCPPKNSGLRPGGMGMAPRLLPRSRLTPRPRERVPLRSVLEPLSSNSVFLSSLPLPPFQRPLLLALSLPPPESRSRLLSRDLDRLRE